MVLKPGHWTRMAKFDEDNHEITTAELLQVEDFQYGGSDLDLDLLQVNSDIWSRC